MTGIAVADGIRTMSDDTYHHRVYSGVIHAANDASYLLVVTGGAAMAALIFATAIAIRRYAILPRWISWFGFAAGVAAIASIIFFTMLFWLLWVAVASVALFLQSKSAAEPSREPAPAAA
jgi:fatty acid desaturase